MAALGRRPENGLPTEMDPIAPSRGARSWPSAAHPALPRLIAPAPAIAPAVRKSRRSMKHLRKARTISPERIHRNARAGGFDAVRHHARRGGARWLRRGVGADGSQGCDRGDTGAKGSARRRHGGEDHGVDPGYGDRRRESQRIHHGGTEDTEILFFLRVLRASVVNSSGPLLDELP